MAAIVFQQKINCGTSGNTDVLLGITPANGTESFLITTVLVRVNTALTGSGTTTITIGATAGGAGYLTAFPCTSTTTAQIIGLQTTEIGSSLLSADRYSAPISGGSPIWFRAANSGTITTELVVEVYIEGIQFG